MFPFNSQILLHKWYVTTAKKHFILKEDNYTHWTLLTVFEGNFRYQVGDEQGTAQLGDIIFCPPLTTLYRQSHDPVSFLLIEFQFPIETHHNQDLFSGKISLHKIDQFNATLSNIIELTHLDAVLDLPSLHAYQEHLLRDILFLCWMEQRTSVMNYLSVTDSLVQAGLKQIQKHAFEDISLKAIANNLGLSQSQFTRRFQAALSISPNYYLTDLRIKKAQQLLLGTTYTLEEIALQCGYQSGFYLSRVFLNHCKMRPSEYRTQYQF